ncbi:hypothetical protein [Campylobacter mucosalis]|uniref:Uncharacterized protein n=1 Tax=Campylobacter mucosalis CCUG 21559 TaxID=1032067 RepID=A0A6G5QFV2_9BACT|nr:hypothetical protein [Campylobacter mucosalis]QCD44479.1 hypothetical protein CMUC_0682 [Campylobacter mucosalis CCUG 21559]
MANIVLQSCNLEKEWLCKNYPDLRIAKDRIAGKICFDRSYNDIKIVDDSFCLTVYPKEKSFFTNLLEPYWGEYFHGVLGLLEFIAEKI